MNEIYIVFKSQSYFGMANNSEKIMCVTFSPAKADWAIECDKSNDSETANYRVEKHEVL